MLAFISRRGTPQSVFSNFLFLSPLPHAHHFPYIELGLLKFKAVEAVFTPLWCARCIQVRDTEGKQIHSVPVPDARRLLAPSTMSTVLRDGPYYLLCTSSEDTRSLVTMRTQASGDSKDTGPW